MSSAHREPFPFTGCVASWISRIKVGLKLVAFGILTLTDLIDCKKKIHKTDSEAVIGQKGEAHFKTFNNEP